jgi:hypothetical protein
MADIRINSLSTTASSTASDDFLAVDGTTNGTRKLNAYSPSFGGNATVGGTLTVSGAVTGPSHTAPAATNLTLSGGSSGANLVLAQGAGSGAYFNNSMRVGGVAPANSLTGYTSIELGQKGQGLFGGYNDSYWLHGAYYNGGFKYGDGALPVAISANAGNLLFYMAPSGSPDATLTWSEKMRLTAGTGNLLIGTTTDSANGKIQLTSHTTSAGGIGFGTETSVYRAAAGSLVVDHIGGSAPTLNLSANGAIQSRLFFNGTNTFLESYTSHSLILRTNQTTALTLDSSQNATFAKTVNVGNGTSNSSYQNIYTNKSENTAGPVSITLPADCAGTVRVSSFQSGVGRSFRTIPFINFGGTVTLGTSDTTVVTADPVTSVAAGTGAVTLNLVAANTNVYWGIDVVKA